MRPSVSARIRASPLSHMVEFVDPGAKGNRSHRRRKRLLGWVGVGIRPAPRLGGDADYAQDLIGIVTMEPDKHGVAALGGKAIEIVRAVAVWADAQPPRGRCNAIDFIEQIFF